MPEIFREAALKDQDPRFFAKSSHGGRPKELRQWSAGCSAKLPSFVEALFLRDRRRTPRAILSVKKEEKLFLRVRTDMYVKL